MNPHLLLIFADERNVRAFYRQAFFIVAFLNIDDLPLRVVFRNCVYRRLHRTVSRYAIHLGPVFSGISGIHNAVIIRRADHVVRLARHISRTVGKEQLDLVPSFFHRKNQTESPAGRHRFLSLLHAIDTGGKNTGTVCRSSKGDSKLRPPYLRSCKQLLPAPALHRRSICKSHNPWRLLNESRRRRWNSHVPPA